MLLQCARSTRIYSSLTVYTGGPRVSVCPPFRVTHLAPTRWFRHPSYAGFFYWALGTQLVLQNPISFLGFLIVLWRFFSQRIRGMSAPCPHSARCFICMFSRRGGLSHPLLWQRLHTIPQESWHEDTIYPLSIRTCTYITAFDVSRIVHSTQHTLLASHSDEVPATAWWSHIGHSRDSRHASFSRRRNGHPYENGEERDLILEDRTPLRNVDTVQEFTDILVPYTADALDGCRCAMREI